MIQWLMSADNGANIHGRVLIKSYGNCVELARDALMAAMVDCGKVGGQRECCDANGSANECEIAM